MPTRTKAEQEFTGKKFEVMKELAALAKEHGISPVLAGCAAFLHEQTVDREKDAWTRHAEQADSQREKTDE